MTLLAIINDAQDILSLPTSSVTVSSTDSNVRQLVALSNQEGRQLMRRYSWEALLTEKTFTSVATAEQTGEIPTDYDRIVNRSMFNRSRKRSVTGPLSSAEWQSQQALTASLLTDAFRIQGGEINLIPTPTAGDTYAYEYVSKNWCQSSGGTGQAAWAANEDTGVLDENLMLLGLIWRFRKARGLDYAEEFAQYNSEVEQATMRDGGKRVLDYGGDDSLFDHRPTAIVTEGDWGL